MQFTMQHKKREERTARPAPCGNEGAVSMFWGHSLPWHTPW